MGEQPELPAEAAAAPAAHQAGSKSLLEKIQIAVGVILSVVAAYSAWQFNLAEKALKERESSRKDLEEFRADRESREKKQIQVYEAVVKSLESGDARRQAVSKALVTAMLDDPLRTELLAVLSTSSSPEIRKEAEATLAQESRFKTEENAPPRAAAEGKSSRWEDIDFDIFWCERSGDAAKAQAERIRDRLAAEGARGRLRVRLLPDSINARPGYQHSGYVIRYNTGEEGLSAKLKALGDGIVAPAAFVPSFSSQATPWYLSAFVCPVH